MMLDMQNNPPNAPDRVRLVCEINIFLSISTKKLCLLPKVLQSPLYCDIMIHMDDDMPILDYLMFERNAIL